MPKTKPKSRETRSVVHTGIGLIVIEPLHPERRYIRVRVGKASNCSVFTLDTAEAGTLGEALLRHAEENGYDPETV